MDDFHCSFCQKRRREVRKLISGPRVFICDECVNVCKKILDEEEENLSIEFTEDIPKPREIKECLAGIVPDAEWDAYWGKVLKLAA